MTKWYQWGPSDGPEREEQPVRALLETSEEVRELLRRMTCRCGCGGAASYLCTGTDFGGGGFVDDPACLTAKMYLEESASELGLDFVAKPIHEQDDRRAAENFGNLLKQQEKCYE